MREAGQLCAVHHSWYGNRVMCEAPVDYVEGIGGFLLDVVGVWRFELRSVLMKSYKSRRASLCLHR
ncbi:hypothetical protein GQ600_19135 [Phytophthora cactorum]|nr:hypothetical protein GQ600_19135 [Phytophthora cactorum]